MFHNFYRWPRKFKLGLRCQNINHWLYFQGKGFPNQTIYFVFVCKVSEARKRKNRRLKQAKEEAQQEIEKYKQERETEFKVILGDNL